MIFRRIARHVRNQEWTAIAIDLVIVIAGVFIGIQVSNWNEERVTSIRADAFEQRLRSDLREEAWSSQLLLQYNQEVLANAERAVAALEGKATLSDEALVTTAYRATQYKQKGRRRSTYDELTSTGAIGLIRDRRDAALEAFVKRQTGLERARFCHHHQDAKVVIEALKAWLARDGKVAWDKAPQSWLEADGAKIAWAQWKILYPEANLMVRKGFDAEVLKLACSSSDTFFGLPDSAWQTVMNALGVRVRAMKGGA